MSFKEIRDKIHEFGFGGTRTGKVNEVGATETIRDIRRGSYRSGDSKSSRGGSRREVSIFEGTYTYVG
jgi:hypothetical protein